jgi:hypothetical protein
MSGNLKIFDGSIWEDIKGPQGETGVTGASGTGSETDPTFNTVTITGDNDG